MERRVRVFEFRTCTVTVHGSGYISTQFREDGSVSEMHPPYGKEDFEAGVKAACAADGWTHAVQHELAHALVADAMGWMHSWSVWAAAHAPHGHATGKWPAKVSGEEHLCVALQRLANTCADDDPHKQLEANLGAARFSLAALLGRMTAQALA
jgi:hypothetical protein